MPNANKPGTFMPRAVCLGDTLKQNGYITSYLGGASSRFGGKGNFYKTHQFDSVTGLEEHMQNLPLGTAPYSHWGLSDESLFQLAWKEFSRLAAQSKPFAFFLLTLDTHPPHGYPSPICNGIPFGDGKSSILNTYHCSDQLAGNFIRRLLASEVADETIIVVASDHLSLNNDISGQLEQSPDRRNLFFILEKGGRRESLARHSTPFDITPTLLSVLGAEVEDYNLGVNMLSDEKTIMERIENPDRALRMWSGNIGELFY
jgi:phosphoglycerol transferase